MAAAGVLGAAAASSLIVWLLVSGAGGDSSPSRPAPSRSGSIRLVAHPAGRLAKPTQDAAIASSSTGGGLLIGGLDSTDQSMGDIRQLTGGHERGLGSLPSPVHDAAAVAVGDSVYLFGGGQSASVDQITRLDPAKGQPAPAGHLPQPRSDLGAAAIGDTVYLVGGFTGQSPLDTILAWRPGQGASVAGHLPQPLRYAAVTAIDGKLIIAGGSTPTSASRDVLSFDPARGSVRRIGRLPSHTTHATAAALGSHVYVIGGRGIADGTPTDRVLAVNPSSGSVSPAGHLPQALSDLAAVGSGTGILVAGGRDRTGPTSALTMLRPAPAKPVPPSKGSSSKPGSAASTGLLAPGSDPSVLPGNVLIADESNNRLLEITPQGHVAWEFPRSGDLANGQTFKVPDDAFFSSDGKQIVATQEENFVISVIDVAGHRITYRYGTPGVPGSGPNQLDNPDDALLTPAGTLFAADIKNCRLVEIRPPAHDVGVQLGSLGSCVHDPPRSFGSPNGAFPMANGDTVVTEIDGAWVDVLSHAGKLLSAVQVPHFTYPSDTNEVSPGLFLSVDYASPGAIQTFDAHGHVRWRYAPTGKDALDHPSLAEPLPNGDVIANDDYNDRVIVVDPRTNRIVWQYGHTGQSGSAAGFLNNPDGVDLAPPHSLLDRFPKMQPPQAAHG